MIKATHIKKSVKQGNQPLTILKDISLTIDDKAFVFICGPSGSGKTTLLNVLSTISAFDSGELVINDHAVHAMRDQAKTKFRANHLGFVFQDYRLIDSLNVVDNIVLSGVLKDSNDTLDIDTLLTDVDLLHKKDASVSTLSGGEKQRVAIARALYHKPRLLFADEPTGNLDQVTSLRIMELFKRMHEKYNITLLIVTHDESTTIYGNRTIRLLNGLLVEEDVAYS